MPVKKKCYYGVSVGVRPGTYTDISEALKQVKGYPKAVFKKFKTQREAEEFVGKAKPIKEDLTASNKMLISYNRKLLAQNHKLQEENQKLGEETAFLKKQMEAEWERWQKLDETMSGVIDDVRRNCRRNCKIANDQKDFKVHQECLPAEADLSFILKVAEESSDEFSCSDSQ